TTVIAFRSRRQHPSMMARALPPGNIEQLGHRRRQSEQMHCDFRLPTRRDCFLDKRGIDVEGSLGTRWVTQSPVTEGFEQLVTTSRTVCICDDLLRRCALHLAMMALDVGLGDEVIGAIG